MNARERFLACMNFETVDRVPFREMGYWGAASIRRWYEEGLPRRVGLPDWLVDGHWVGGEGSPRPLKSARTDPIRDGGPVYETYVWDEDIHDFFGFDEGLRGLPIGTWLYPPFEPEVLEDHGDWVVWRDEGGVVRHERKDLATLPSYLHGPVQTREDWERLKVERLCLTTPGRFPANWSEIVQEVKERDYPLSVRAGSFFGSLRKLMGVERLMTAYHDEPDLIRDINDHLANLSIVILERVLRDVKPDLAMAGEDMCYRSGMMISPAMFREFMLPYYRRVTSLLRDHGIKVILVDSDGNVWRLIPLLIEAGVTGLFPFEVQAGMDVVEVRKAFPCLHIVGGISSRKVAAGKTQIDEELEAKLPFMLPRGGYLPHLDHNVPPDISWGNFVYYRRRLAEMANRYGCGGISN